MDSQLQKWSLFLVNFMKTYRNYCYYISATNKKKTFTDVADNVGSNNWKH